MEPHESPREAEQPSQLVWGGQDAVILVPLDGSDEANLALPVARLISRVTQASIHVLHVADKPLGQQQLLRKLKLLPGETEGLVVDQATGSAANAIVERAVDESTLLIVMTTRGASQYRGRLLRPVTEQVVREAPCPVLLVRPEQRERVATLDELRHILLPLDGAPSTEVAVHPAVSLAEQSGAELDILYVAEAHARQELEAGTMTGPRYVDQPQYEWPAWTEEFVERFCACAGECPPRARLALRSGDPATEILGFTKEHPTDLIVLEWHGSFEPERASVIRAVLAGSPCPVLLLRATR